MQAYSCINSILLRRDSTFAQFQGEMLSLRIEKETYLNLFLTAVAVRFSQSPDFPHYLHLLLHFKSVTGKKSADVNYIGYKDRIPVLMHACTHSSPQNIRIFLSTPGLNLTATDPMGRSALFYAISHSHEGSSCAIASLLLDAEPAMMDVSDEMGNSPLMAAAEGRKYGMVEMLLRRGADANAQRRDTEETVSHCLLRNYKENKEQTLRLLMLLKHKANFHLGGKAGSVFQAGLAVGVDLSQCLLEDCEEDKESLTTLNQMTKMGDNASELEEIQSNFCSQKINFSEADLDLPQEEEFGEDELRSEGGRSHAKEECDGNSESQSNCEGEGEGEGGQIDFLLLSQEILQFSASCEQRQRNVWISLSPFLTALQKLANKHGLLLEVVGSFATGLWSTFSDIDINLIPADGEYRPFQAILQRIFKSLHRRKHELGITELLFVRGKVNSIKMGLNERMGSLVVDVAVFHRNNQNRSYVTYVLETLNTHPQVKPLFLVLKKLCETFDLHDHLFGGLKTYTLFLMIRSIVKNLPAQSPGELLLQVALYYGFYYEYEFDLGGSWEGGEEGPRAVFNFIDPLNPKNNVGGKSTRVEEMVGMFRGVYLGLLQMRQQPYLHQLFQLHSIF